jgi:hypothetical protein
MRRRHSYHLIDLIGVPPAALEPLADLARCHTSRAPSDPDMRLTAARGPEIELRGGALQPSANP